MPYGPVIGARRLSLRTGESVQSQHCNHRTHEGSYDAGVPTLTFPSVRGETTLPIHDFSGGGRQPVVGSSQRYESDPTIAILTTTGDSRFGLVAVRAGTATSPADRDHLVASMFTQPLEVPQCAPC